ncbi:hypothetical protein BT69DRAFT_981106 [Atractiella rhizophila]|nr:hypothetical protein BT69DRAFT_981106 [Atractiella rhizophila]
MIFQSSFRRPSLPQIFARRGSTTPTPPLPAADSSSITSAEAPFAYPVISGRRGSLTPNPISKAAKLLGRLTVCTSLPHQKRKSHSISQPNASKVDVSLPRGSGPIESLPQEIFLVVLEELSRDGDSEGRAAIVALSSVNKLFRRLAIPKLFTILQFPNKLIRDHLKGKKNATLLSDEYMVFPRGFKVVIDAEYVKESSDGDLLGLDKQFRFRH